MDTATSLRERMKAQRQDLMKRREEQQQERKAGRWGSIFVRGQVPQGRNFWSCKEGGHILDVIPFLAGPHFPPLQRVPEGEQQYYVDVWVHQGVGPTDEQFVCPSWNFKKPCPICEFLAEKKASGKLLPKEEYNQIKAKERTVYLIWCHDSPEEERKGIQIWELAAFFFQDKIEEIARDPRGRGIILFDDPDTGKSVSFRKKGKGVGNTEYLGHQFLDRDAPIPDDILNQSFPIDTIIKWEPTYDEIHKAFFQDDTKAGADKPAETKEEKEVPETERATDATPAEQPADPPPFEPDQPEEAVSTTGEEVRTETTGDKKCPGGGTFGVDIDKLDMCANECNVWDDCDAANIRLKKQDVPKEKPKLARRARANA